MKKRFLKMYNWLTTILVGIVVIIAILLAGVRIGGLHVYSILSGSMEPEYPVGALIYVQKTDPYELQEGDVITFLLSEDMSATHRIVGIVPDEEDPEVIRFRTKGDANNAEDGSLVHYKNVVGKPIFKIPYLGYLAEYIKQPPGLYAAIAAGLVLLVMVLLPDILISDEDDEQPVRKRKHHRGRRRRRKRRKAN